MAALCDVLTDNRNRSAGEIRKCFEVHGGNLGASGCVAWMFERKGMFLVSEENSSEEALFEIALEAGAEDVTHSEDGFDIICDPTEFDDVSAALEQADIPTEMSEITRIASSTVDLDTDGGRKVLKLLDALEELEDVQNVTANFNIPNEVMAELSDEE